MDFVRGLLISCFEYVNDFAMGVSESFTGADSGAALIVLVFYLSLAIVVLLLLILLVRTIRSFFAALFGKTQKKKFKKPIVQPNPEREPVQPVPQHDQVEKQDDVPCLHGNPCQRGSSLFTVESFDGQVFLDRLSAVFNNTNSIFDNATLPSRINAVIPPSAPFDGREGDVALSSEDMARIVMKIGSLDLSTLRYMLEAEVSKESELGEKVKRIQESLSSSIEERLKLSSEEAVVLEKYNTVVDEILALNDLAERQKETLSIEYSKLFNQISEYIALRNEILGGLERLGLAVAEVPGEVDSFAEGIGDSLREISAERSKKDEVLNALKNSYFTIHESREKTDDIISSFKAPTETLRKAKLVQTETVAYLRSRLDELEKLEAARAAEAEAARLAAEAEAERLAKEEAERLSREEAKRLAQEEEKRRTSASAVDAVRAQVQRQAQEAYALNYDDISPDMYEKIVESRSRHRPTKPSGATEGSQKPDHAGDAVGAGSAFGPDSGAAGSLDGVPEDAQANEQAGAEPGAVKPDYFAVLQKEWAAEREHREQWQAEQEQKRAEEERRRQELSGSPKGNAGSNNGS